MLLTELLQQKPLREVTFDDIDRLDSHGENELLTTDMGSSANPPNSIDEAILRILWVYNYCLTRGDDISEQNLQLLDKEIDKLSVLDGDVSGLVARFRREVETIRDGNRRMWGQS